jgi:endonuclease/exonuclease/phosphatase family metal-dependent hydrolase
MVFYWLVRRRSFFLLSLVAILVGWNVLADSVGFNLPGSDTARPQGDAIRIMTYNVHGFRHYGDDKDTTTKHAILQILREQGPDVIGFQEFFSGKKSGGFDMQDSIMAVLNTGYFYYAPFSRNKALGMAIFSKFPIINTGTILLSDVFSENQCIYIDVKKDNRIFRIYSVHLQSIRFDQKDYTSLDSVSGKGKTNIHSLKRMISKLKSAFAKRSEQVFKVKDNAANCPYPYIISGDFNDTPGSFAFNQMVNGMKDAFREKGSGFGQTYNGDFPNYQIDFIMPCPKFDVISYEIIKRKLSDHYPVRSDLVWH